MGILPALVDASEIDPAIKCAFIIHGYRSMPTTFAQATASLCQLHTETINIWSHLLPLLTFVYFLLRGPPNAADLDAFDITMYNVHCVGCIIMLGTSTAFHWFQSIGRVAHDTLLRLDFAGIASMIVLGLFASIGISFRCKPHAQRIYLSILAICGLMMLGAPWYSDSKRNVIYAVSVLQSFAPLTHLFSMVNGADAWRVGVPYACSLFCYIAGGAIYSFAFPEKQMPGRFDIFGKSHQIWHLSILLAVLAEHHADMQMLASPLQCT